MKCDVEQDVGKRPVAQRPVAKFSRNELGKWGEECAALYLRTLGCVVLDRNWRARGGELDIVAFDPHRRAIVAVEVKTRRSRDAGTPEEAVTAAKVRRLRALLVAWVASKNVHAQVLALDVIGVNVRGAHYTIDHLKGVM